MSAHLLSTEDRRHWSLAGLIAAAAHLAVAGLVLAWARSPEAVIPEPVVLVELPPAALDAAASTAQPVAKPEPERPVQPNATPLDIPPVRAPLPSNPVVVSAAQPLPVRQTAPASPANPVAVAQPVNASVASTSSGNDPRAKKQEADYFSLVSAHLNRRKTYPAEARQARQQGVVTVRFTVDRNGSVSGASIKRSSGHELLDRATLDLLRRVAPLPRMPTSMQRDSITLSLPIDYALRTS